MEENQRNMIKSRTRRDLEKIFSSFRQTSGAELQDEFIFPYGITCIWTREDGKIYDASIVWFDPNGVKYSYLKSKKDDACNPNNVRKNEWNLTSRDLLLLEPLSI